MRKNEIEKKLKTAISNATPEVLENILNECNNKKGFEESMEIVKKEEKPKKEFNIKNIFSNKLAGVVVMAMICLVGILGYVQYDSNYKIDSIVDFDVNPSVEFEVNKKEKVIGVNALNEDGKKIIGDMDLINTDIEVATNAIAGSMLRNGYLTEEANSILVSVKNADEEKGNALQEKISTQIDQLLKEYSINGAILTQMYNDDDETKSIAEQYNLSQGKASLINQLLKAELKDAKGNVLTAEALSGLTINDLNLLLTSKQTQLSSVHTMGSASESSYIGREKAKEIALNHAKVAESAVSRIEVEFDYDDGKLVYEVDFRNGNIEYDYEIDAVTGVVLQSERENDGSDGDSNYDDTDYGANNDGVTDYGTSNYDDTDYGPNNDGVTDYGTSNYDDTDYGPNNDGVTDYGTSNYDDTDYGPNGDGVTDYTSNTNSGNNSKPSTNKPSNNTNYDDGNTNYDSGNSNYSDSAYDNDSGYDSDSKYDN